jgi:putative ABC transport system permease protein
VNIFNKVTLQSMKKNRTRTIVTIIGVVLSAAMITAVATFGTSLLNFLVNGSIVKYGGWHVEFLDVDSSFVQERTHDNGVANTAAFENIGYATLDGGKSPEKPYLFIAGFSKKAFDTLPISLISGRLPENGGEILVPAHVAAKGGVRFKVGDTLSLAVGSRMDGNKNLGQHDPYISGGKLGKVKETLVPKTERTYTVVGICERPGFEEHSAPGYTLITKADTADKSDSFSIFVTLKNPRQVHTYASSIAEQGLTSLTIMCCASWAFRMINCSTRFCTRLVAFWLP